MITAPSSWENPENHLKTLLSNPWYTVLNKVFSQILTSTHDFYYKEGIEPTVFPITTGSVSSPMGLGSDSSPVAVEIKNHKVFLADSMQFSLEIGARLNKKGSYYVMPTFRGENTDSRHLNEFVHSEVEIKGNLTDIKNLAERYIKHLITGLLENCSSEIASVTGTIEHLTKALDRKFVSIRFEDAQKELSHVENALQMSDCGEQVITSVGEKELIKRLGDFTWLTNMPWLIVPFYQAKERNTKYSMTADLLGGIGEMLGSGQRVLNNSDVDESLKFHQVDEAGYLWYKEMRDIQTIQTSGFGLGTERFLLWVLKHDDIRDCTLLVRDHSKIIFP